LTDRCVEVDENERRKLSVTNQQLNGNQSSRFDLQAQSTSTPSRHLPITNPAWTHNDGQSLTSEPKRRKLQLADGSDNTANADHPQYESDGAVHLGKPNGP